MRAWNNHEPVATYKCAMCGKDKDLMSFQSRTFLPEGMGRKQASACRDCLDLGKKRRYSLVSSHWRLAL